MSSGGPDDPKQKMMVRLNAALDRLHTIWDKIGLNKRQQASRTDVVVEHLNNLLDRMIVEEEAYLEHLLEKIKKHGRQLLQLSKELGLPPYEPPEGLSNILLEKDLDQRVKSLKRECQERMTLLRQLQKEEQHLCDIMCTTPLYISAGSVPTQTQLDELQEHITSLKKEKERRYQVLKSTKSNIIKMLAELDQNPNTSFERELLCEEDDSFLLTNDNMAALKQYAEELEKKQKDNFAEASQLREYLETLWERLDISPEERMEFRTRTAGFKPKVIEEIKQEIARCELMKKDKMEQVIEKIRQELLYWWDKCHVDQAEREKFKPFTDETYTEALLADHEEEVQRLKSYYEDNKEMLELVDKWQKLFNRFLEDEKRATDPNRYVNRGGNLLKEEKARKRVQKELPKVEEEVRAKIQEWEESTGKRFLINGMPFTKYIEESWKQYHEEKERRKAERLQAKARLIEEELKYGSRPAHTPNRKRALCVTPGRTPNKRCRIEHDLQSYQVSSISSTLSSVVFRKKTNDTTKTPTSYVAGINRTGRINHTSVFSPMTPRSTTKPKATTGALHNRGTENIAPSSNETGFSQTTVSGPLPTPSSDEASLDSVGPYQDFAQGLRETARPNCRSSVLPADTKPAYF